MQFEFSGTQINVNMRSYDMLMTEAEDRLRSGRGFGLATINLDHLVKLRESAAFRRAYAAMDLVTADGNPIVWLARLAGEEMHLLPGSDLVVPMAQLAAKTGRGVALLGSTEESLELAGEALKAAAPGLEVVLRIAPPMGFDPEGEDAARMLAELDASGAGICYLALGAPKQEQLAARGQQLAPHCGFMCIGAGLDFLSGSQTRAPAWVRKISMEWLWRMLSNPRRLAKRYFLSAMILPGQALRALGMRGK